MSKTEARIYHLEAAFCRLLFELATDDERKARMLDLYATFIAQTTRLGGITSEELRKAVEDINEQ